MLRPFPLVVALALPALLACPTGAPRPPDAGLATFRLSVTLEGPGAVHSMPSGLDCPGACAAAFPSGATVVLQAAPLDGGFLSGWASDCAGTSTATLTLSADRACTATFAASPTTFATSLGGQGTDDVAALALTPEGGYLLAGVTHAPDAGAGDAWLAQLDGRGEVQWQQRYGGEGEDKANAVVSVPGGGFVVAGYSSSFGAGDADLWVFAVDARGALLWQRSLGGAGTDWANALLRLPDGRLVVAGFTESFGAGGREAWVLELDASGAVLWQKAYGGTDMDSANAVVATPTGLAVAGFTKSFGASVGQADAWVLALTGEGAVVWQKTYGGPGFEYGQGLAAAKEGGLLLAGWTSSWLDTVSSLWALKLDESGAPVWQEVLDGDDTEEARAVVQTADGDWVLAGTTWSFGGGGKDFWVVRLSPAGQLRWQRTYGAANWDWAHAVAETPDGKLAVAGYTSAFSQGGLDGWLLKLSGDGSLEGTCPAGLGTPSAGTISLTAVAGEPSAGLTTVTPAVPGVGTAQASLAPWTTLLQCRP